MWRMNSFYIIGTNFNNANFHLGELFLGSNSTKNFNLTQYQILVEQPYIAQKIINKRFPSEVVEFLLFDVRSFEGTKKVLKTFLESEKYSFFLNVSKANFADSFFFLTLKKLVYYIILYF